MFVSSTIYSIFHDDCSNSMLTWSNAILVYFPQ